MKINVAQIVHDTIVDGPGIRTSIYLSGCKHYCEGCHNKQTWNPLYGKEMTLSQIIAVLKKDPLDYGVSLSGGDPFYNPQKLLSLLIAIRKNFPNKNILVYTGYYLKDLTKPLQKEALKYINILIDGPFIISELDFSLQFRGSKNQNIIILNK